MIATPHSQREKFDVYDLLAADFDDGQYVFVVLVGVVDCIHLFENEKDAEDPNMTQLPRHIDIGVLVLQRVEGRTAIAEMDDNAIITTFDFHIHESVTTFGISVRRDVHDNLLACQAEQHEIPRPARGDLGREKDGLEYLAGLPPDGLVMQEGHGV